MNFTFSIRVLVFAFSLAVFTAMAAPPRVFILDGPHIESVRARLAGGDKELAPAMEQLKRDAEAALTAGPFSVINKTKTPPSGSKHDYMSQAPYFWPNPDTTNGLPYIRRDGVRNPEIRGISDHRSKDEMVTAVETLALAYYFTGEDKYAVKSAELIRAWFLDPSTRMNPNLEYAQFIPGVNTGRGIGLIETRSLTRVVDSAGLMAGSKAWTARDDEQLKKWFGDFLKWMMESRHGIEENAAKNNHGTYYDVQAMSFALYLGNTNLTRQIAETAKQKRIVLQIEPDGAQPLELARTRAWSYSVGNLNGLMLIARLSEHVGVDLWNYESADGRSIPKALDFLIPFALGKQKFTHQQLGDWPPHLLFPVIRQAALKYPKYRDLASQLPPLEASQRSHLVRPKITAPTGTHNW